MLNKWTILAAGGAAAALALAGCASAPSDPGAELYYGFTRIDPETRSRVDDAWLVVAGGEIVETGTGAPPRGDFAASRQMSGAYAIPGLIDAHGHILAGPQVVTITDTGPAMALATDDEYSQVNAAAALAFGVTSLRNPGGSAVAAARYDAMIASGAWAGPEAVHAGDIIQPDTVFRGESFAYPTTPEAWDAEAARQAAEGMTYFKLYTDLSEEEVARGAAAAKAHGLIPIAHLNAVSWTRAVELGVEQLEHALPTSPDLLEPEARAEYVFGPDFMTRWWELADLDGPLMAEMIDTLVENEVEVDLTLIANEIVYFADRLDEVLPVMAGEIPDYMHPDLAALAGNYEAMAAVPEDQLARSRAVWPKVLAFAKLLHDSGVRLMIGTDGPGGGEVYAHELYNHVRAGIGEWEVLRMATSGNADLIGMGGRTGRIAAGYEADLVFLTADPVEDIRNVGRIALVVNNGEAAEPEALLEIARGIAGAARARAAEQDGGAAD